jgi:hypothetical protein
MPVLYTSHRAIALMVIFVLFVFPFNEASSATEGPASLIPTPHSPQGYHLGHEQQVSTPITPTDPDRFRPDSAYDAQNGRSLVVWHQTYPSGHDQEVYGQLVDVNGSRYGAQIVISSGAHDRRLPAVAYNPTNHEYLVVYMYDVNGDGKKFDIRGQRIGPNGALIGSSIQVFSETNTTFWSPRIVWNAQRNEYMVVFVELAQDTQISHSIGWQILNGVGTRQTFGFVTTEGYPGNPDITFDPVNHNYLIVWNFINVSGHNAIEAELRDSSGGFVRSILVYGSTTNESLYPRVSSCVGLFFTVVWEYIISNQDHDIYNALVTPDATTVIPAPLVQGDTNDTTVDVAGSSGRFEYMVTYQRADANGAKIYMLPVSGSLPKEDIEICNTYLFANCDRPSIEFGGSTYLNTYIAYQYTPNGSTNSQPSIPATTQDVFDRPFYTAALFLPLVMN